MNLIKILILWVFMEANGVEKELLEDKAFSKLMKKYWPNSVGEIERRENNDWLEENDVISRPK